MRASAHFIPETELTKASGETLLETGIVSAGISDSVGIGNRLDSRWSLWSDAGGIIAG